MLNQVNLIGHLGADPEGRDLPSGSNVCNFRVATSERWKDRESGDQKERTEWHSIVVFGKLAEICGKYLQKGSKVYLSGKLQTRKWQDRDGNDRWSTEVVCNQMVMLDSKRSGGDRPETPPAETYKDDDIPF